MSVLISLHLLGDWVWGQVNSRHPDGHGRSSDSVKYVLYDLISAKSAPGNTRRNLIGEHGGEKLVKPLFSLDEVGSLAGGC